uniref:plasminogen isoform X2 n=1 Tax=Ciona intestinalis TaxID=7719 RepID=UPI00006A650B|nr:plasminogen isoform X2 [Ciona intestinalis]|eukprot:XP_018666709.1 plasminogen isoform X2 [Ciona intestinalis]
MKTGLKDCHRRTRYDVTINENPAHPIRGSKLLNKNILFTSNFRCMILLLWLLASPACCNDVIGNVTSSGRLLSVMVGNKSILSRAGLFKPMHIKRVNGILPTVITPTFNPYSGVYNNRRFSYRQATSSRYSDAASNFLRTRIFSIFGRNFSNKSIQLAGSYLPYMGRVQVSIREQRWGTICGDQWDAKDATVACRELGFAVGGVIARPRMEFGRDTGPVVLTQVKCRGDESKLSECRSTRWDGHNSLECGSKLTAAGVVCGCPIDVPPNVHTRCFIYTSFPNDSMYCMYSCKAGEVLVGSRRRRCGAEQTWSGTRPYCVPTDSPCSLRPCRNGGSCQDYLGGSGYSCTCVLPYAGRNCEYRRSWGCGVSTTTQDLRTVRPQLRIVGGRNTNVGSWPWVVQLRDNDEHFCVGTLIAPQWVATAAHCMKEKGITSGRQNDTKWSILVGQHSLTGFDNSSQTIGFYSVTMHNYTNIDIPRNDIALIKLNHPVVMGNQSGVICLPGWRGENPEPGTKCWVAGWGRNTPVTDEEAPTLHHADIPILSNSRCRRYNDRRRDYSNIPDDVICAGYDAGGVDACKGDSGGPLMCLRSDDTWYLAGVVSWGYGCAQPNTPGVYTRVSHYLNWIYNTLQLV